MIKSLIKKSAFVAAAAPIAFTAAASAVTLAWPGPITTANCTQITVQEVAPDSDWVTTKYWSIQGVNGQFARGQVVTIADSTSASRSFTISWHDAGGNVLDSATSDTVTRNLAACQPTTTVPPVTVPAPVLTVPVINGPADPIPPTPVVSTDQPPVVPAVPVAPAVPPAVQGSLPATGLDVTLPLILACVALVSGVIMMVARRRNERPELAIIKTES